MGSRTTALGALFATTTALAWGGQFVVGKSALGAVNAFPLSTVRIVQNEKSSSPRTCTGTLITQNKVLTAAHCVASRSNGGTALLTDGLQALERCWLDTRQIEAARVAIARNMKRHGKMWIRVFPQKSYTKKPLETRMGKGKGPLESWVAVIRPANVLFEVDGVTEAVARESLRLAATKLPIKTKFISRHRMAQL